MHETISFHDCLKELQRTLAYRQLSLPLWAFEEGLTPDEARHRINCLKGSLCWLLGEVPAQEAATP